MTSLKKSPNVHFEQGIEYIIFASRWLQAPLYLGLIVVQCIYAYKFIFELFHIVGSARVSTELQLLLGILGLVDFTMVANLVAMVIIGGYATFVSKLNLDHHDDKPDWLDHIDPGTIKVKLASSLIGISSIHLLQSFIDIDDINMEKIKWQIIIHMTFIASTVFLSLSEYMMSKKHSH
jgi:uncharacterized protein (TIGR00645 family)